MKKVLFIICLCGILLIPLVLSACLTSIEYGISQTYDDLTETSLVRCKLKMPIDPHVQGLFDKNIITFYKSPGVKSEPITMTFHLMTSSWHFIEGMILKIDGDIQRPEPFDIDREVVSADLISEVIAWNLPVEVVKKIGESQRTQIRFLSDKGKHLDFEFDTEQKGLITKFIAY